MKVFVALLLFVSFTVPTLSYAQSASTKDAQYLATLAAVMNYKINDEKMSEDLDKLRGSEKFTHKLQKKLGKLSNDKNYDAINRRVMEILKEAGRELDLLL